AHVLRLRAVDTASPQMRTAATSTAAVHRLGDRPKGTRLQRTRHSGSVSDSYGPEPHASKVGRAGGGPPDFKPPNAVREQVSVALLFTQCPLPRSSPIREHSRTIRGAPRRWALRK